MYIALTTLFISFVGIILMVGRRILKIDKGEISIDGLSENPFKEDIEKIKYTTKKNAKKYGFLSLFALLRFYIISSHFLKKKSLELAKKIEEKLIQSEISLPEKEEDRKEVNKHLRVVSDYIEKIRGSKRVDKREKIK